MRVMFSLLAVLLLITACAGEKTEHNQLPPPPADDTQYQTQPLAQDAGNIDVSTGDEKAEFEALAKKAEGATFTVTYETSDTYSGSSGEMRMYSKGKRSRMDMSNTVNGQLIESQLYGEGDSMTQCMKQNGEWNCFILPGVGETDMPGDFQSDWNDSDMSVTKTGTKSIAGTTANCYEVNIEVPDQGMVQQEVCVSKEGVLLSMEATTPQGTMTWKATDYSTSVSDDVFTPPAEPQDMDAMMTQMMQQYNVSTA